MKNMLMKLERDKKEEKETLTGPNAMLKSAKMPSSFILWEQNDSFYKCVDDDDDDAAQR